VQFAHLTQMQTELDAASPQVPISILGVNYIDAESGSASVTNGTDLPWLQDVVSENVWSSWGASDKSVFILGIANEEVIVYSVALHDLGVPDNFNELKQLLLDTAAAQ
jgi:hypothetical protein